MNPQEPQTPNFELPPPGGVESTNIGNEDMPSGQEVVQVPSQERLTRSSTVTQPITTAQTMPLNPPVGVAQALPPTLPDPTQSSTLSSSLQADDLDLIEKEWVEKAKEVVDKTQGDPYIQNREINKIKADYIKKRYNKDIKLSEE